MKRLLSASIFLFIAVTLFASTTEATIDDVTYLLESDDNTATVYRHKVPIKNKTGKILRYIYVEYTGSVTIPETVEYEGTTYTVSGLNSAVFYGSSELTSVVLPSSITEIPAGAFEGCTSLTNIDIPSSVISIGRGALDDTPWYNNLPDGMVYIGKVAYKYKGTMPENTSMAIKDGTVQISAAFSGCTGLTSIDIPSSVTNIGRSAFSGCTGLTSIDIPSSVTSIGSNAFSYCTGLTSITIPSSVTSIGDDAFYGCTGLTSINIPSSVTRIGAYAFSGCSGLTSLVIPESVTSIGIAAFNHCENLTSVNIPSKVTVIEQNTFFGCSSLSSITIPENVKSIGYIAFCDCSNLNSITIPKSVALIDLRAFDRCSGLTSIVVEDGNTEYDSRGGCNAIIEKASNSLIRGCKNTVIPESVQHISSYAFGGCSGLTSITIPESVTDIGSNAFYKCTDLTSISIPSSVTRIDWSAFDYCTGLKYIYSYIASPTSDTGSNFYSSIYTDVTLYVPKGTKALYQDTDGWKNFQNIVEFDATAAQEIGGTAAEAKVVSSYSIDGKQLSVQQKGMNIIKMSDGTTRKIVK